MLVALGVIILYVGSLIEVLDISMAAIASLICVIVVIEYGGVYSWMVYAATAALAFLVLPEKFTPSLYATVVGYYPIIKEYVERIGKKSDKPRKHFAVIHWCIKLAAFNVALVVFGLIAIYMLLIPVDGFWALLGVIALVNLTFIIYDVALTRMISMYFFRIRKRLKLPGGRKDPGSVEV